MTSRRRSRNRSIVGNLTDMQKRLKYLESRQAPTQLARKVVSTQNIALRAINPDVVADNAIVRRALAPDSVISANLSVVGDIDGAAVATENIQFEAVDTAQVANEAITNDKLAGEIEDDKIVGVSASKIGPDLLQDDQLDGISTGKLIGSVLDDQIDGISAIKIGPDLIQDDQIDGISGEKIIGGIDGALIVDGSITGAKIGEEEVDTINIAIGAIGQEQLQGGSVGNPELQLDSVGTLELQDEAVTTSKIAIGAVGTDQIAIEAVTASELADLAIERQHMTDNVIIARMINAGAVQTEKIQNLAVSTAKIANGAVDSSKLGGIGSAVFNSLGLQAPIGGFFGQGLANLRISVGSGASQVAAGNHTHAAGGIPSHTHPVSASITGSSSSAGAHTGHGGHSHPISISSTITTSAPSSLKLKKEISDHEVTDIKNILNLKLKKYKYKNQLRHLQENINREWMHGYIAEEVQELGFEELLGYDEKGEPASLNYGLLSTLILELVKVQQTEIDSLKEEIQRLKEKI